MLILGTCIYQFSGRGKEIIIERIGWRLPLLDFLNAMYIYSWTIQEYRYGVYQPWSPRLPPDDFLSPGLHPFRCFPGDCEWNLLSIYPLLANPDHLC